VKFIIFLHRVNGTVNQENMLLPSREKCGAPGIFGGKKVCLTLNISSLVGIMEILVLPLKS